MIANADNLRLAMLRQTRGASTRGPTVPRRAPPLFRGRGILAGLFLGASAVLVAAHTYVEEEGLAVVEMESEPMPSGWQLAGPGEVGHGGRGYVVYLPGGPSSISSPAEARAFTFTVRFSQVGLYRILLRTRTEERTASDQYNDVWLSLPQLGCTIRRGAVEENLGTGWFKVYQPGATPAGEWVWQTVLEPGEEHHSAFFARVSQPGDFQVRLAGRSSRFQMDRVVFYQTTRTAPAHEVATPASPRLGAAHPWEDLPVAEALGNSPWFGRLAVESHPWIWHLEHGWLYQAGSSQSSLWHGDSVLGWWWTGWTVYPWVYLADPAGWRYFGGTAEGWRWLFDPVSAAWSPFPPSDR